MHKNGWRPFWAALGAALLVLLPLVGGTVLLTRQMVRTRIQTAQPQSGVPIQLPRAEHRMTLLLCTAGEQPGFLLVYLNAAQNSLNLLAVPGELTVPFNGETASLAHCYGAAGPARCRQALLEVLGLPEDMLYLALSPAVLEKTASRYGPVRVGFSGALTADELAETELSAAVQSISVKEAHALLSGWDADGTLPPARRAAARAAVWEAFFRQDLALLPATLPDALDALLGPCSNNSDAGAPHLMRCWACRRICFIWRCPRRAGKDCFPLRAGAVGFSGALTAELAETGLSAAVQTSQGGPPCSADGTLRPPRAAKRQDLALLPATLPDALRASSTALLTDFAAQDYTLLGTVLEFLANNSALPHAEALPGAWDAKAGTYTVTDASRAAVQTFLSVSPASGNDASLREP